MQTIVIARSARVVVGALAGLFLVAAGAIAEERTFRVEPAPEWDALFDRTLGWTGADGIYSVPLDGDESSGRLTRGETFFIFSDTFIGKVQPDGSRHPATVLVNNTMAWQPAGLNTVRPVDFYFATRGAEPISLFDPSVRGANERQWYWMKDGIALGDTLYLLASRFRFDWTLWLWREGVSMIEIPLDSRPPFRDHAQRDVPLKLDDSERNGPIVYGGAIFANTVTARAPGADGYIYVYGTEEVVGQNNKRIMVARVPEADFAQIHRWRFFDGTDWVRRIDLAEPIAERGSMEFSVSPLPDGRYIMVFQLDQVSRTVAARIAPTPWGPFGRVIRLYDAPEAEAPGVFAYNAKAHPHLSRPGELLISYNVNTLNNEKNLKYADIYRPRFIRLIFE